MSFIRGALVLSAALTKRYGAAFATFYASTSTAVVAMSIAAAAAPGPDAELSSMSLSIAGASPSVPLCFALAPPQCSSSVSQIPSTAEMSTPKALHLLINPPCIVFFQWASCSGELEPSSLTASKNEAKQHEFEFLTLVHLNVQSTATTLCGVNKNFA